MEHSPRQNATTLAGIRDDHKARYRHAIARMREYAGPGPFRVLDAGCGSGYGSHMLAQAGFEVLGFDKAPEAIDIALRHYSESGARFAVRDFEHQPAAYDLVCMFEVLEHTLEACEFMRRAATTCKYLVGSVPNEQVVPFTPGQSHPEHYRHFTLQDIVDTLNVAGWVVRSMQGQLGKRGPAADVTPCGASDARTLVFFCVNARDLSGMVNA